MDIIFNKIISFFKENQNEVSAQNVNIISEKFVVEIVDDSIQFYNYPFSAASVYPSGKVEIIDIREIIINFFPPALLTQKNELLFVSQDQVDSDTLAEFAKKHNIDVVARMDLWSMILDEFLDTEFSSEDKERTLNVLEEQGVTKSHCHQLRQRLSGVMFSYNFDSCLWEWCYLGLYDVLNACAGNMVKREHAMSKDEFRDFYVEAMRIACNSSYR